MGVTGCPACPMHTEISCPVSEQTEAINPGALAASTRLGKHPPPQGAPFPFRQWGRREHPLQKGPSLSLGLARPWRQEGNVPGLSAPYSWHKWVIYFYPPLIRPQLFMGRCFRCYSLLFPKIQQKVFQLGEGKKPGKIKHHSCNPSLLFFVS